MQAVQTLQSTTMFNDMKNEEEKTSSHGIQCNPNGNLFFMIYEKGSANFQLDIVDSKLDIIVGSIYSTIIVKKLFFY